MFTEFVTDNARYGWASACEQEFGPGVHPVPIVHEWNSIAHLNAYEGNPEARAFTREEMQRFVDYADDQVERAIRVKRKGALTAYRDATLFKVIYGWGLRRTEAARLDIADWGRNPAAAEFGRYGTLHVRYGKAKRGQPPRRRNVASVMAWAVEAVADYVDNVRPRFGCEDHPALWVTERGGRIKPAEINARFEVYRDALKLPKALTPHSFRHSYVSHLTEDGVDRRFIQVQVGHECDSSTAIYTKISPTTLTRAYDDAGYFSRNMRTIEVLVDRDAVASGAAAAGEPWQHYDLGHGFCTYTFFEQCPHRMACARCDFYTPKTSSTGQLLEAKDNLQRMLATIPLSDDERAAVDDGQTALDNLLERLIDIPTPAGATPREISAPPTATLLPIVSVDHGKTG